MEEDDKIIRQFFDRIKEVDERRAVPRYPMKKSHRVRTRPLLGIAAAVIVLVGSYFLMKQSSLRDDTRAVFLEISVNPKEGESTGSLAVPASMDSWESPTNSLIADF